MNNYNFLYSKSYMYSNIKLFEDLIVLENKIGIKHTSYSSDEIVNIITKYGKKLYELLKENSFNNEIIDTNSKKEIQKIFMDYYKNIGYVKNYSKDNNIDKYKIVYIDYSTILDLKDKFIKFYLLYSLYGMLGLIPLKPSHLKKINEYMQIINPDFSVFTADNEDCLYNEIIDLIAEQFNYNLKVRFELVKDDLITFNIVSTDIYALGLYAFSDIISLNEFHKPLISDCKICKKKFIKKSNNQKYCSKCKKNISYSKNLDNHKLEIIEKILYFKEKENYYAYWNNDFKFKFDDIVKLANQSRDRLKTPIKDLKSFYKEVLEKVNLNTRPYNN